MTASCADVFFLPWLRASACGLLILFLAGCATSRAPRTEPDAVFLRAVPFYPVADQDAEIVIQRMMAEYWQPPARWWRRSDELVLPEPGDSLEAFWAECGWWLFFGQGTESDIKERLRAGAPVWVYLQSDVLDTRTLRSALVVGFDERRVEWKLYGLGDGPVDMTFADFSADWQRADNRWITLAPPMLAGWPLTAAERLSRGRLLVSLSQYGRAVADFSALLTDDPSQARHYVELADAHLYLRQFDQAEALYRAALALDGLFARAMNNLAYTLIYGGGDMEEAVQWARNAVTREPDNPRMLDTLGVALHRAGELREASRVLQRARARAMALDTQTQVTIAAHLIAVYHDDGQPHLARQTLADLLALQPDYAVPEEWQPYLRETQTGRRRR